MKSGEGQTYSSVSTTKEENKTADWKSPALINRRFFKGLLKTYKETFPTMLLPLALVFVLLCPSAITSYLANGSTVFWEAWNQSLSASCITNNIGNHIAMFYMVLNFRVDSLMRGLSLLKSPSNLGTPIQICASMVRLASLPHIQSGIGPLVAYPGTSGFLPQVALPLAL